MKKFKKFRTGVIDPPWPYDRVTGHEKMTGYVKQEGNTHYETMTLDRLAGLPIESILDGYLFLWTTGPFVPAAIELVKTWGFRYKAMMYWVKMTATGKIAYGPGWWVRSCVEPIVIAAMPGTPSVRTNERAAFQHVRLRHSEKPEAFQDFVERHFPGPRVELFARRKRAGWTCLGAELTGNDITEDMRRLAGGR